MTFEALVMVMPSAVKVTFDHHEYHRDPEHAAPDVLFFFKNTAQATRAKVQITAGLRSRIAQARFLHRRPFVGMAGRVPV